MNKLLFSEGGQPLHIDDLEFMQNSMQEAIGAVASSFGNCILSYDWSDINYQGTYISWNDLYVYIDGKIAFLPEGEITENIDGEFLYIELSDMDDVPKTFNDGSVHKTRKIYRAEMKMGTPPSRGVLKIANLEKGEPLDYNPVELIGAKFFRFSDWKPTKQRTGVSASYSWVQARGFTIVKCRMYVSQDLSDLEEYIFDSGKGRVFGYKRWHALLDGGTQPLFVYGDESGNIYVRDAMGGIPKYLPQGEYNFYKIIN